MKVHTDVDSESGLIHSASVTPGSVHNSHDLASLLYADSAYWGAQQT